MQAFEAAEASMEQAMVFAALHVNLLGLGFALKAAVFENCSSAFGWRRLPRYEYSQHRKEVEEASIFRT